MSYVQYLDYTRLLVPVMFTFPYVLTKHCGVVPGLVDRWHHLLLVSLYVYRIKLNPGETNVN